MKFNIGYSISSDNSYDFIDIVKKYKEHIDEVYFPWLDNPTGRASLTNIDGYIDWNAQTKLIADLKEIKAMGIKLDLLYNGNCMGGDALSLNMQNTLLSIIDYLRFCGCAPDVITTASPAVAFVIKSNRKGIDVRASVNMRIGTVKAMQYLKDFDSFYIMREYNRDFLRIKELKEWADNNGKRLYMLANSGCMSHCSYQTFHDNTVAHSNEIATKNNIEGFVPYGCWEYLKDRENWVSVLQNTWVRPEDISNYEEYFSSVKLATRMHMLPALVVDSYVRGKYYGNLLDLFEPGYGRLFAPYIIDNTKFPKDWFITTAQCDKQCYKCNYCNEVLKKVIVKDADGEE